MQPFPADAAGPLSGSDDALVFVVAVDPLSRARICYDLLSEQVSTVAFEGVHDLLQRWIDDEEDVSSLSPDALVIYGPELGVDRHLLKLLCELTGLIPVVMLDHFSEMADRKAAFDIGCSAVVPLPHLPRELADAVRANLVLRTVPVKTPRVLLADPDPVLRDLIAFYLRDQQWEVVEVADGEAAMNQIVAQPFDIMVLETALPFVSGLVLLQRIRAQREARAARVVFLSARSGSAIQKQAFHSGVDGFVAKPFDPEVLIARLKQLELSPRPVRLVLSDAQRDQLRAVLARLRMAA